MLKSLHFHFSDSQGPNGQSLDDSYPVLVIMNNSYEDNESHINTSVESLACSKTPSISHHSDVIQIDLDDVPQGNKKYESSYENDHLTEDDNVVLGHLYQSTGSSRKCTPNSSANTLQETTDNGTESKGTVPSMFPDQSEQLKPATSPVGATDCPYYNCAVSSVSTDIVAPSGATSSADTVMTNDVTKADYAAFPAERYEDITEMDEPVSMECDISGKFGTIYTKILSSSSHFNILNEHIQIISAHVKWITS